MHPVGTASDSRPNPGEQRPNHCHRFEALKWNVDRMQNPTERVSRCETPYLPVLCCRLRQGWMVLFVCFYSGSQKIAAAFVRGTTYVTGAISTTLVALSSTD